MVVCAAIKNGNTIICGIRHFDSIMRKHAELYDGSWEQGFVDNKGKFLTRQEAWDIACKNDQIRYHVRGETLHGGTLFSENLY